MIASTIWLIAISGLPRTSEPTFLGCYWGETIYVSNGWIRSYETGSKAVWPGDRTPTVIDLDSSRRLLLISDQTSLYVYSQSSHSITKQVEARTGWFEDDKLIYIAWLQDHDQIQLVRDGRLTSVHFEDVYGQALDGKYLVAFDKNRIGVFERGRNGYRALIWLPQRGHESALSRFMVYMNNTIYVGIGMDSGMSGQMVVYRVFKKDHIWRTDPITTESFLASSRPWLTSSGQISICGSTNAFVQKAHTIGKLRGQHLISNAKAVVRNVDYVDYFPAAMGKGLALRSNGDIKLVKRLP